MKKGRVILTLDDDFVNKNNNGLPNKIIAITLTGVFKECLKGIDCITDVRVEVTDDEPREQADDPFDFNSNSNTLN